MMDRPTIPWRTGDPPETGYYLVTHLEGCDGRPAVDSSWYFGDFIPQFRWNLDDVIAWAPMPEPYNPEENDVQTSEGRSGGSSEDSSAGE